MTELTEAQFYAQVLEGKATTEIDAITVSFTGRLPLMTIALLDTFAEVAGSNRTKAAVKVFDAGIEAIMAQLDERTAAKIRKVHGKKAQELLKSAEQTSEKV